MSKRAECQFCHRRDRLTKDGVLYRHDGRVETPCEGSGSMPVPGTVVEYAPSSPPEASSRWDDGPWLTAMVLAGFAVFFGVGYAVSWWVNNR